MNMKNYQDKTTVQTHFDPIDNLELLDSYIKQVSDTSKWDNLGMLVDEGPSSILFLLLENDTIITVLRLNFDSNTILQAIKKLNSENDSFQYGVLQGQKLTKEEIVSLTELNSIWRKIELQKVAKKIDEFENLYNSIIIGDKQKGRGKDFSVETERRVKLDAKGYCMFSGCGEDLDIDSTTGEIGNYKTLAHNIGSSEQGPRGIIGISNVLSDDPNNVLILCEKHHRLVDKIAAVNYDAITLSEMRKKHCETSKKLLKALGNEEIQAYSILWPVAKQKVSSPSEREIAQCLNVIESRLNGQLNRLSDNENTLLDSSRPNYYVNIIDSIESSVQSIINQTRNSNHNVALFAMGLMPGLIALGAKLSNKNKIIPMLRYRDGGHWVWPSEKPKGAFYDITGLDTLCSDEKEVIIRLLLTDKPRTLENESLKVSKEKNIKIITIEAKRNFLGNGSLAHPEDGSSFTTVIHKLLHELKNKHNTLRVHLFPCASNAACVFFGQAFDNYLPDIIVYDFVSQTEMESKLLISAKNNECSITVA